MLVAALETGHRASSMLPARDLSHENEAARCLVSHLQMKFRQHAAPFRSARWVRSSMLLAQHSAMGSKQRAAWGAWMAV
jgi:hypothetical protein